MPSLNNGRRGETSDDYARHKADATKAFLENHYQTMLANNRNGRVSVGPRQKQPSFEDFTICKCIGRGAFGEVSVCHYVNDKNKTLYALKQLRKADMIMKKQVVHVRSEKNVLAEAAATNPWVVHLYSSFQNADYLYMLMEYMPGGDMISWLCDKGIFDVESTRFYIAELCAAVASVHEMGFVHRDIKPDNILFAADGHIKLSDFGLSKRFEEKRASLLDFPDQPRSGGGPSDAKDETTVHAGVPSGTGGDANVDERSGGGSIAHTRDRKRFQSIVGSPGYIAPEILMRQPYDVDCDWWSVGVIMYEMLYGIPPFYSQNPNSTCQKIKEFRTYLRFPPSNTIPEEAVDFMQHLICEAGTRMDYTAIKNHKFLEPFRNVNLRTLKAPYIPELSYPLDTRYFPEVHGSSSVVPESEAKRVLEVDPRGVMFADFRFNYHEHANRQKST